MEVTAEQASSLQQLLAGLVTQYRALSDLDKLNNDAAAAQKSKAGGIAPLIERLDEYPAGGADLTNLVDYPPKVRPIPVKPIFLDLAWNYIDYPGQAPAAAAPAPTSPATPNKEPSAEADQAPKQETKKGWFWNR
jgi:signal recognition particle subunit SRP68